MKDERSQLQGNICYGAVVAGGNGSEDEGE